jgi:hypothetical protein
MSRNILLNVSSGELTWDVGGTPVVMGPTKGGIMFKSELSTVPILQDGYGDAEFDAVTKGRVVTLEINMSEMTAARLSLIQGVVASTGPVYTFDNSCGVSLRDVAKKITIKPIVNLVTSVTTSEWFSVFKVSPPLDAFEIGYDDENQRLWKAIFKVFPDDSTGNVGRLYAFGE